MPGGSVRAQCRKQKPLKVAKAESNLIRGMGSGESSGWAGAVGAGESQTGQPAQTTWSAAMARQAEATSTLEEVGSQETTTELLIPTTCGDCDPLVGHWGSRTCCLRHN